MRKIWGHEALENRIVLKAEGLSCHKLVTDCMAKKIIVRDVKYRDDMEIQLTIYVKDYKKFQALARNRYIITELENKGAGFKLSQIFSRKSFLVGFGLFLLLIYYRSGFVSEVHVEGLDNIAKDEFYQVMESNGLYVGCRTNIDRQEFRTAMYQSMDDRVNWINLEIKGTRANVEVAERKGIEPTFDYKRPCDLVAKKDGYIIKYIAKNGTSLVKTGQFVSKGQTLISGTKTITGASMESTADGKPLPPEQKTEYFHALGDFYARVIYHFNVIQERYEVTKEETGRNNFGIRVQFGNFKWNSYYLFRGFDRADEHSYTLLDFKIASPKETLYFWSGKDTQVVIELLDYKEVNATKRERTKEEIAVHMKKFVRDKLKEEMPKSAQILKQDIKYDATESCVKVTINLETREEISVERAIPGAPETL